MRVIVLELVYQYIGSNCYKTKRLEDKILELSTNLSSVKASKFFGENIAEVYKNAICNMIKKIRTKINKIKVKKICIDNFAIKKCHKYATVMIDIDNHKIVNIIESRKDSDVAA